jgi:peptidoglycan/xylan/chitin deacetylase (PgdA/CDA1 family)
LRRFLIGRNQVRLPILMYHSISETPNESGRKHPYFVTETSLKVFDAQMKYLRDSGYSTISVDHAVALLNSKQPDDRRYVVITFDDGYRDFYSHAFPVLNKYGFCATVYLPTAYINHESQQFLGKACLTWSDVRELYAAGVQFGSHTVTHPKLKFLSSSDLEREIWCSKDTIENKLGTRIKSFSFPYAFPEEDREFMRRLQNVLEKCGYENGVSTIIGSVQSPQCRFFLKRLPASSCDDRALFRAKLDGGYDWLHRAQYLSKLLSGMLSERSRQAQGIPTWKVSQNGSPFRSGEGCAVGFDDGDTLQETTSGRELQPSRG